MQLLNTFTPPDQQVWLAQIQKELRDQPIDQAGMELEEGITTRPFIHPASQPAATSPLWSEPIDWAICQEIDCSTPSANANITQALNGGVTALRLIVEDLTDLPALLNDIYLQMIDLRIAGQAAQDPEIFEVLGSIMSSKGLSASAVSITLENDFGSWNDTQRQMAWLDLCAQYPTIYALHLKAGQSLSFSGSLTSLLKQSEALFKLVAETRDQSLLAQLRVHFSLYIGKNYFAEIARLRAWYLLWYNQQKRWNLPIRQPILHIDFEASAYSDALYTNMIRATTMAMSAVTGGCSSLTVLPFDANSNEAHHHGPDFANRIARNVQHLLKLESGVHLLADTASGSYYIEDLTHQLAEKAWVV